MPPPLKFKRHFIALGVAVIAIVVLNAANLFPEPFLPSFAIYGALHAAALMLAIDAPDALRRKSGFIILAAVLNAAMLYAGIFSLEALGGLPAALRLYAALSICALFGACGYGLLIRAFWYPSLRPRAILQIAAGCTGAACAALGVEHAAAVLGSWWLVAVWWFAFSSGLWLIDRRTHALRPQADTQ